MTMPDKATLLRLSDTNMTPADPTQDIRGRKVIDANGADVGDVDDLLIDDIESKVRFMQVASGGFLGIGEHKFLIPVDTIARIDNQAVYIDRARELVAASPEYDPELVDQSYVDRIYQHYGFMPYWMLGYTYPMFPYYV
jgi:sporulation protein YlmC with PRC-barrel domain